MGGLVGVGRVGGREGGEEESERRRGGRGRGEGRGWGEGREGGEEWWLRRRAAPAWPSARSAIANRWCLPTVHPKARVTSLNERRLVVVVVVCVWGGGKGIQVPRAS